MPEAARAPRTQQQRRDETRRALLDAAVESADRGRLRAHDDARGPAPRQRLARRPAPPLPVQGRAARRRDRSPRRDAGARAEDARRAAARRAAGRARTDAVLELLWQCFAGTFFQVAMELRTAARTDPELRPVLDRRRARAARSHRRAGAHAVRQGRRRASRPRARARLHAAVHDRRRDDRGPPRGSSRCAS